MYLTLLFLPLYGSFIALSFGRWIGAKGASLITTLCIGISALLSWIVFYEVAFCQSICLLKGGYWIESELFDASWGFLFDSLTVVMCVVVTTISSLVHLYATSYMSEDPHLPRFMSYLSIFTFFMLILVSADNYLQMFFGWEGIGLASFLLINFWFTRLQANKAATKAMIVNRVGDLGLALGIFGLFATFKSVDYATIFACVPAFANQSFIFFNTEIDLLTTLAVLLFVGVLGKSAQLGLHTWLPDAMEGPTPVSALIHAATLVTAGVFMIARSSIIFEYAPTACLIVCFIGAMTSFFAATTGIVQNDLKRVIAYSTCSQLGYMVFICGLSGYSISIFHLMNHAFFKALLFLSAGAVIHALSDEQDMRKFGGLVQLIPFTYMMIIIGSLALIGFPFLTGFYSKDTILEIAFANYNISGSFAYWLGSLSVCFTSYYSFRLIFLTFFTSVNGYKSSYSHIHDAPLAMAIPFIILSFGSLFIGYYAKDMMIGGGSDFWGNTLFTLPQNSLIFESEIIPQYVKFIPLFFTFFGASLSYYIILKNPSFSFQLLKKNNILRKIYGFLNKRWLFDKIYNDWIAGPVLFFGYQISFKVIDKGALELLGPTGIPTTIKNFSRQLIKIQSGFIYHYAFMMLIGLTFLLSIISLGTSYWWLDSQLLIIFIGAYIFYHSVYLLSK